MANEKLDIRTAGSPVSTSAILDVKPGDTVVVEGQLRIVPGSKVQIRNNGPKRSSAQPSDMPS